jgi:hypothetical protein
MVDRRRDLKLQDVGEAGAPGDVAEVYDRIKRTLRVGTVNYVWRVFASKPDFLRAVWDQLEPAVDGGFLEAADGIRAMAIERVREATNIQDHRSVLGDDLERASEQLRVFLEVNPRLLVLLCALRQSWAGTPIQGVRRAEPAPEGAPEWHPEIDAAGTGGSASKTLKDMQDVLDLPEPNTDYLVLASWPDYLDQAWGELRTFVGTEAWDSAIRGVDLLAEQVALALPAKIDVSPRRAGDLGLSEDEVSEVGEWIEAFHGLLPGLILSTSYFWLGQLGGVTPLPPPAK